MSPDELNKAAQGPLEPLLEALGELAETNQALLIEMMRLYDVQMALLTINHPDLAKAMHERHAKGGLVGPMPVFDYNQQNLKEDDEV